MEKTIRKIESKQPVLPVRERVAAYARVSSGKDAMLHSLSAQVSYFSNLIQRNPEWHYVGVYVDEAITGTTEKREGFQRMLADCRAGKIDRIITKCMSRFARNTVTLLKTVRELKELGIDVYFEKQNIHSMSGDGELMLSILASFAQEESRSVSENCKWRIRKNFEEGIPTTTSILGYRIRNGDFEIIPQEAEIVRMIFHDYISGMGRNAIQRKLTDLGLKGKWGGDFHDFHINEILHNEKYVGDLLLQKTFCDDHLTKRCKRNKGELPRYYICDHHEAIIDRRTFELAQRISDANRAHFHAYEYQETDYPFTSKIICGICGKAYRRKITHGKVSWQCGTFLSLGKAHCPSKRVPEDVLLESAAGVLGLERFDDAAFRERVQEIQVPSPRSLLFILKDGSTVERTWQFQSRRESWTDEMKAQAAEHARRRFEK